MWDGARLPGSILLMVRTTILSAERPADAEAAASAGEQPSQDRCPACGAEMAADQEWCLECGAAVTQIYPPPDWRIGLAIVLGVIAVVAIVVAVVWP